MPHNRKSLGQERCLICGTDTAIAVRFRRYFIKRWVRRNRRHTSLPSKFTVRVRGFERYMQVMNPLLELARRLLPLISQRSISAVVGLQAVIKIHRYHSMSYLFPGQRSYCQQQRRHQRRAVPSLVPCSSLRFLIWASASGSCLQSSTPAYCR